MKKDSKFHFKKSFGQNFLMNEDILRDIVDFSCLDKESIVLEIGPGSGNLTKYLSKVASKVIAIELDKTLINDLSNKFKSSNVSIYNYDFLKLEENDFLKIYDNLNIDKNIKLNVCANIPYNITSPIIRKLLEIDIFDNITLMIQKEVADRIVASVNSKDYGILTLTTKFYADVVEGFVVKKENFYPSPKVDSKVIRLIKREAPFDKKFISKLFNIIKCSFNERRKTLINSLSHNSDFSKEDIKVALEKIGKIETSRAENLSLDDFIALTNILI